MTVVLDHTPDTKTFTIRVSTCIRKKAPVLKAYLQSLAWQEWPERVRPDYLFIWDGDDPEAFDALTEFCAKHGGKILQAPDGNAGDFDDQHPMTHIWQGTSMERVGKMKDHLIEQFLGSTCDALFFCDADLILDRTTVKSLWFLNEPIACAVYWTHWHNPGLLAGQLHAAPQVWLDHPYQLSGRGYEDHEFRAKLVSREKTQVWGQGACTLIRRHVLEKGVRFAYLEGVSREGMMGGEDRHFCLNAESRHIPMYADPWPDIFHVYHKDDERRIPEMVERLGQPHPDTPSLGDLASLILDPLEPAATGPNQFIEMPAQWVRGRLGALPLVPEIEDAILHMKRGERQIVVVNFPVHHPMAYLRGQRRLIEVTLVDCKPWGFPPVLEQEMLVGKGVFQDRTTLTAEQQA